MDTIIRLLKKECKPSLQAVYEDGKLERTVANYGLALTQTAKRGGGEYAGLTVKPRDHAIRPLLTDYRVIKALEFLKSEKMFEAAAVLQLEHESQRYGFNIVYWALDIWLTKAGVDVPEDFTTAASKVRIGNDGKFLKQWIVTTRSDPILEPICVVDPGYSKQAGGTVVPESWVDRCWDSAVDLHHDMSALEWRRNMAPVHYCLSYFIEIVDRNEWADNIEPKYPALGIAVWGSEARGLTSSASELKSQSEWNSWCKRLPNTVRYIQTDNYVAALGSLQRFVVAIDPALFEPRAKYDVALENAGVLVSRVQKATRRGRGCAALLKQTLEQLNKHKPYNLPEQQFLRVSGSKQCAWRLLIIAIEDVLPFGPDPHKRYLGMMDLACLAIVCSCDPDLQYRSWLIDLLVTTALCNQRRDGSTDNTDYDMGQQHYSVGTLKLQDGESDAVRAAKIGIRGMQMMSGDRNMLVDLIKTDPEITPLEVVPMKTLLASSDTALERSTVLASYDMHACPYLLLMIQGSMIKLPTENITPSTLSHLIWDISSSRNIRNQGIAFEPKYRVFAERLVEAQQFLSNRNAYMKALSVPAVNTTTDTTRGKPWGKPSTLSARMAFIAVWGRENRLKYAGKVYDVVVCGTPDAPCRIKRAGEEVKHFIEGAERIKLELAWAESMEDGQVVKLPYPPLGYRWACSSNPTLKVRIVDMDTHKQLSWWVDDVELDAFDATPILEALTVSTAVAVPPTLRDLVQHAFYHIEYGIKESMNDFRMNMQLRKLHDPSKAQLYDWQQWAKKIPPVVWRTLLVKFNTMTENHLQIGPVDGHGDKLQFSIHPQYEGTMWRIMNAFCTLYPRVVSPTSNILIFKIDDRTPDYLHLHTALIDLGNTASDVVAITGNLVIKSKLWDHQQKTVTKMVHDFLTIGRRGLGDASDVGSGKTLTSLAVICQLLQHAIAQNIKTHHSAVVMVPTAKLYDTWTDEIHKHTGGFHVVTQAANGELSDSIQYNSVVITTMGRMRDHPLTVPWLIISIDECLSVQNKNALQTGEAWRQVVNSYYGVMLLSATFFRSRIDKLFYMLKMLATGLPEDREYLTAILSETIVCNLPAKTREWKTNVTRLELDKQHRAEYERLKNQEIGSEKLYSLLGKYIYDHYDYPQAIVKHLNRLHKQGRKVLIFSRSRDEADTIVQLEDKVGRFPDISKDHVVGSYAECGQGVNTLTKYDCILCRPPHPDWNIQMRGRIDRPGQKSNVLYQELILLSDTIEEAGLLIMELENRFRKKFIIPIASYYDLGLGRKKITEFEP
jgi:hypothetical protein